ncbi:MAG TPA: polysaccharide pyruvyl transferase family protein [Gryllotalpicola sp.]
MTDTLQAMPTLDGLARLLAVYRGHRAWIVPMTSADGTTALGNNGDRIMHEVFHRILARFDIVVVGSAAEADFLAVPPNGALLEVYQFPELLAERIRGAEAKPLVIFPSSTLFPHRDPAFMFRGRTAPTLWITRERYSSEHLRTMWSGSLADAGVTVVLDHDVVASGHEFVPGLVGGNGGGGGLLVAGRKDKEAADLRGVAGTPRLAAPRPPASAARQTLAAAKRLVPYGPWYTAAARFARRRQLTAAADALLASLPEGLRDELAGIPRGRAVDLSAVQYATYREYLATLRRADAVVTNRLHVALPAAILGKRVVLVEAGYHKLQGVYEQSLSALPNVELVGAR